MKVGKMSKIKDSSRNLWPKTVRIQSAQQIGPKVVKDLHCLNWFHLYVFRSGGFAGGSHGRSGGESLRGGIAPTKTYSTIKQSPNRLYKSSNKEEHGEPEN